jgi:hypothetical protein
MSRRLTPRAGLPADLPAHGLRVSSAGDTGGFEVVVDLATGLARMTTFSGRRVVTGEAVLPDEERAQVLALAEAAWSEEPRWWGHPQTVVGDEELAIVDGDDAFFAQAWCGWFTDGAAKALVEWARTRCAVLRERDPSTGGR